MYNLFGSILSRSAIVISSILFVPACDEIATPQIEYRPHWQKIVDTNPLDGSKDIQMLIRAVKRTASQRENVILVLTCNQGTTSAYVVWRQYLGTYDPEVTWRVGSDPSVAETWSLSTDNEATFSPRAIALIKQMMTHDLFLIRTAPFGKSSVTLEFNTGGLINEIDELREACDW